MIKVYNKGGRPREAEELFRKMQQQGFLPDPVTYLLIITTYGRLRKPADAEMILNNMKDQGFRPGTAHYTAVILAYGEAGLVKDANRIYDKMQATGIKSDVVCQRTMLRVFLRNKWFREGVSFVQQVKDEYLGDEKFRSLASALYRGARRPVEELIAEVDVLT